MSGQTLDTCGQLPPYPLSADYSPLTTDYWKKLTIKTFYIEKKARTLLSQYMYPNEETIRKYFTSGFAIRSACL